MFLSDLYIFTSSTTAERQQPPTGSIKSRIGSCVCPWTPTLESGKTAIKKKGFLVESKPKCCRSEVAELQRGEQDRTFLLIALGREIAPHRPAAAEVFCPCGVMEELWGVSRGSSSGFCRDPWEFVTTSTGGQLSSQLPSCLGSCPSDFLTHIRSFAQTKQEPL